MLKIKHLTYVYNQGTPYEKCAVNDIDFEIKEGEFVGIIGCTGSGKSTLIQHFNGLLKPTSGTILYKDEDIFYLGYSKKRVRGEIGLVVQYPE